MDNLSEIKQRHHRDRWKDAIFIVVAVLLTALAIGSVTSKAAGKVSPPGPGNLTVVEQPEKAR